MSAASQDDEHATDINLMMGGQDWAGLIRYWIAHQYEPACRSAIAILEEKVKNQSMDWKPLADFVVGVASNPCDLNRQSTFEIPHFCTTLEAGTLRILELYPVALLCEGAAFAPAELRSQLLDAGLQASAAVISTSKNLRDDALCAFFLMLAARAQMAMGELKAAHDRYQEALEILRPLSKQRPAVFLIRLARALNGLGAVQCNPNELTNALVVLKEASEIIQALRREQPGRYAADAASVLDNVGNVEYVLNRLDDARVSFGKVVELRRDLAQHNAQAYLPELAAALNNLAVVETCVGDWEAARLDFETSLVIRRKLTAERPHIYLPALAETLNNLGNLQRNEGRLEESRDSLEEALKIRQQAAREQPAVFLPLVATTLGNLGNTQQNLNLLDEAHASYQEASEIYRELARHQPEVFQPDLAGTLRNLANAQLELGLAEPALTNCEQSAEIYRHLAKRQPEAFLPSLAGSQNNLGNVQRYFNRSEKALISYGQALDIYRALIQQQPDVYRPCLATGLANLGTAQSDLRQFQLACASFMEAAELFRQLAMDRPNSFRPYLVIVLNSLGNAQRESNALDAALTSLGEAKFVCDDLMRQHPEVHRPDLARIMNNLGTVHRARGAFDDALTCIQSAAALYTQEAEVHPFALLAERLRCWTNLGSLYGLDSISLGWPDSLKARQAFRKAVECAELLRGRFVAPQQRHRIQTEVIRIYERLVQSCVDVYQRQQDSSALKEAVEVAEAARSRQLLDLLQDERLEPDAPPLLVKRFHEIHRRLRLLQHLSEEPDPAPVTEANGGPATRNQSHTDRPTRRVDPALGFPLGQEAESDSPERWRRLRDESQVVAEQYHATLREIQTRYAPEFDPDQPVPPVKYEAIQALLPTDKPTAIVQYCLGLDRSFAIIHTPNELSVVPLPGFRDAQACQAAAMWFRSYYDDTRKQAAVLREASLQAAAAGDASSADRLREQAFDLHAQWTKQWEAALPALLEPVSMQAVRPVADRLARLNVNRLIISPNRSLHLFPLHACRVHGNQYLTDKYEIVYTPSLSLLHSCAQRQRSRSDRMLLVTNPTADLLFAEAEGENLRRRYPTGVVLDVATANKHRFVEEARASTLIHYSGHCTFDPADPLGSALVLGSHGVPEDWLSLREVFCRLTLPKNRLAVLNGCESGMLIPDLTDNHVNLPTGFLYAGATCVISTLWSVFDLPTALLMDRFHDQIQQGESPAAALREAQRWLREDIASGPDLMERVLPAFLENLDDPRLRDQCLREAASYAQRAPSRPPFESPAHWASFAALGLAYRPHLPSAQGVEPLGHAGF